MPAAGRPTKCTPSLIEEFCSYIEQGLPRDKTCDLMRITKPTFYGWKKRGEAYDEDPTANPDDEIFSIFFNTVKVAEAHWQLSRLQKMEATDKESPHWQLWMTQLERRDRKNWNKTEGREISGPGGGAIPLSIEITVLGDDD